MKKAWNQPVISFRGSFTTKGVNWRAYLARMQKNVCVDYNVNKWVIHSQNVTQYGRPCDGREHFVWSLSYSMRVDIDRLEGEVAVTKRLTWISSGAITSLHQVSLIGPGTTSNWVHLYVLDQCGALIIVVSCSDEHVLYIAQNGHEVSSGHQIGNLWKCGEMSIATYICTSHFCKQAFILTFLVSWVVNKVI